LPDKRLPWMKFYPSDWSGDEKLSMCSLAARGLLASCLHLMHMATPYGYLLIHGRKPSDDELAMFVRCKPREVKWGLEELLKNKAVSETADHIVYSRRMVRDAARRQRGIENAGKANLPPGKSESLPPGNPSPQSEQSTPRPIASGLLSSALSENDPAFQRKVGDVSLMFPQVYLRVRKAHYQSKPVRDYPNYQDLARGWSLDRLEKMLEVFLLMPAKDANNVPGTPGQFAHMAPECDRRLRENGL
jgi:hypothetical protein